MKLLHFEDGRTRWMDQPTYTSILFVCEAQLVTARLRSVARCEQMSFL